MAGPPTAAIKARIIAHMNTDHPDSIEDYLKFYNSLNAAPQSAQLVDLDLDHMKIQYRDESGKTLTSIVQIKPPMTSFAESQVKLVAMAEEATAKSFHQAPDIVPPVPAVAVAPARPKKAIEWTPPELPGFIAMAGIIFGFWALSQEWPLSNHGPLRGYLPTALWKFSKKYREQLFAMMLAIHLIEGSIVARTCWEEGMSFPLVVLWTINGFLEGGPAIVRINKLVSESTLMHEVK